MKKISKIALVAVLCVVMIISLTACNLYGSHYEVEDEDSIILNAVFVSDIHTDGIELSIRNMILRHAFSGISNSQNYDLFLSAGDNTNSGVESEYENLYKYLEDYLVADKLLFAMGNHDSWHESVNPDYQKAKDGYLKLCKYTGIETDKTYYSTTVNGLSFIFTGYDNARLEGDDQYISDEQFAWLEEAIKDAEDSNLPIFIIHHQPYMNMNDLEALRLQILLDTAAASYDKPIVVVTGHRHLIGKDTFKEDINDLYYLNLPSLMFTEDGGLGFAVEVYSNKILFKARDFIDGIWVEGYNYTINY